MPTTSVPDQQAVQMIDTQDALKTMLEALIDLPPAPPSLYVDLEGSPLSRKGKLSILSLFVSPLQKTFLIDIMNLGTTAFTTQVPYSISLASILASGDLPKVLFDVRADSDALFGLFGVELKCATDVQLMELASRDARSWYSRDWLAGLAKCVENHATIPAKEKKQWRDNKHRVILEGQYYALSQRPLSFKSMEYCAQDVTILPHLWKVYSDKLAPPERAFWRSMVEEATNERLRSTQGGSFIADAKENVRGPWSRYEIQRRTELWVEDHLEKITFRKMNSIGFKLYLKKLG
ncbi:exonuclease [Amylocarpus encephaloides]|uniref:Exonuclease n=1 Tax=Amylocarpus encephaloides TaxID=45428 RepID=A0A9P8C2C2_9HELO|nr:exonuclease [Amylocarpus encephaloides]